MHVIVTYDACLNPIFGGKLTFLELTSWELTFWEVDILGVDILGVEILRPTRGRDETCNNDVHVPRSSMGGIQLSL